MSVDPAYPDYLQLRTGQAPPPDPHEAGVRVYADDDGALRSVQSDGTDAPIGGGGGGGGSQLVGPYAVNFDDPTVNFDTFPVGDDLPSGCWVMKTWMLVTTAWISDDATPGMAPTLYVVAANYSDNFTGIQTAAYDNIVGSSTTRDPSERWSNNGAKLASDVLVNADVAAWNDAFAPTPAITALKLGCSIYALSGTGFTQGQLELYGMVVTP